MKFKFTLVQKQLFKDHFLIYNSSYMIPSYRETGLYNSPFLQLITVRS